MFYLSMHMNDMSGTIPTELGRLGMLWFNISLLYFFD
jgi:hypothetical protein